MAEYKRILRRRDAPSVFFGWNKTLAARQDVLEEGYLNLETREITATIPAPEPEPEMGIAAVSEAANTAAKRAVAKKKTRRYKPKAPPINGKTDPVELDDMLNGLD